MSEATTNRTPAAAAGSTRTESGPSASDRIARSGGAANPEPAAGAGAPVRRGNLVAVLAEALRARILRGDYPAGTRLPSAARLCDEHGVSRTVVREAIAALRADGLVLTRQGSGAFVVELPVADTREGWIRIDPQTHSEILECLELRIAIEVEAAGMAASRGSPAQVVQIAECLHEMKNRADRRERVADADFAFHVSIATAANNRHFVNFLLSLGTAAIPRARVQQDGLPESALPRESLLMAEHAKVVEAISAGDADGARLAMRIHLANALARYQSIFAESRSYA